MKRGIVVLGLIVAVMAGVMLVRGGRELRPDAAADIERDHAMQGRPGARLAADAVLAISPRVASPRPGAPAPTPKLSPAMQEYTVAKAYKPIYERLKAAPSRSPEETWLLAKIVDDCAAVAGRDASSTRRPADEEAMARFAATLSPKDPLREKRIAAFGAMNGDRCEGQIDERQGATKRRPCREHQVPRERHCQHDQKAHSVRIQPVGRVLKPRGRRIHALDVVDHQACKRHEHTEAEGSNQAQILIPCPGNFPDDQETRQQLRIRQCRLIGRRRRRSPYGGQHRHRNDGGSQHGDGIGLAESALRHDREAGRNDCQHTEQPGQRTESG